MSDVVIYHNPKCSKSRQTLELLRSRDIEPRVVLYLEDAPSRETLERLVAMLGGEPLRLVRTKEPEWRELDLGETASPEQLIDALVEHPKLLERPIVVSGTKARIGRPPEAVLEIL